MRTLARESYEGNVRCEFASLTGAWLPVETCPAAAGPVGYSHGVVSVHTHESDLARLKPDLTKQASPGLRRGTR